jgi:hypothetical protein
LVSRVAEISPYALRQQPRHKKARLMATSDADMRAIVERTLPCFAATTNPDGSPNLSPKSSLRVHDEGHLLFANIASPGTLRNLRRDPRIAINCVDIFARRGYRFTGRAAIHSAGDPLHVALAEAVRREHGSGSRRGARRDARSQAGRVAGLHVHRRRDKESLRAAYALRFRSPGRIIRAR